MEFYRGLPDGPGWSPDGGKFWVADGKMYWEDGDVTDSTAMYRTLPNYRHDENYSLLTEEERAARLAQAAKDREAYRQGQEREEAARQALRLSALAKLTPEEAEACELFDVMGEPNA